MVAAIHAHDPHAKEVLVEWIDGTCTWEPLAEIEHVWKFKIFCGVII